MYFYFSFLVYWWALCVHGAVLYAHTMLIVTRLIYKWQKTAKWFGLWYQFKGECDANKKWKRYRYAMRGRARERDREREKRKEKISECVLPYLCEYVWVWRRRYVEWSAREKQRRRRLHLQLLAGWRFTIAFFDILCNSDSDSNTSSNSKRKSLCLCWRLSLLNGGSFVVSAFPFFCYATFCTANE